MKNKTCNSLTTIIYKIIISQIKIKIKNLLTNIIYLIYYILSNDRYFIL